MSSDSLTSLTFELSKNDVSLNFKIWWRQVPVPVQAVISRFDLQKPRGFSPQKNVTTAHS